MEILNIDDSDTFLRLVNVELGSFVTHFVLFFSGFVSSLSPVALSSNQMPKEGRRNETGLKDVKSVTGLGLLRIW